MQIQHENEIVHALQALAGRQSQCKKYLDYYEGRHPVEYGSQEFRKAVRQILKDFRYNLCPIPIDAVVDKLQLIGMQEGAKTEDTRFQETSADVRLDSFQGKVHVEALRSGMSFVLLWNQGGVTKWYLQKAHLFELAYAEDDDETPVAGVKCWKDRAGKQRLTLYYSDRCERYTMSGDGFTVGTKTLPALSPYEDASGPWLQRHDFGKVPAVEFCNREDTSELEDLIPLQNALNKQLLDLLLAAEAYGIPQRWIVGLALERDVTTGVTKNPLPKGGGVWVFEGEEIKLGQFQAADIAALSSSISDAEMRFARAAGLPPHYLGITGTNIPSGEALRVVESRLSAKAHARTVEFGNSWEDVFGMTWGVDRLSSLWAPTQSVSETEKLAAATQKKGLGIPDSQIWKELGYTQAQIDQMSTEKEAQTSAAATLAMKAFSSGAP